MQSLSRPASRLPRTPREAARRRDALDLLLDAPLFAALADPTRARLLACVAKCRRPCSVGEVAACTSVDLSVVSRHLRALEQASVLASARDGRTVRYALRAAEVAARLRRLADAIESKSPSNHGGCCDGCC